jgi:hypothetical protein
MRLMALLAVCSTKEGMEVSFKEVEQALALEEGQAEGWLVQAFGKQLLDGRINQVHTPLFVHCHKILMWYTVQSCFIRSSLIRFSR